MSELSENYTKNRALKSELNGKDEGKNIHGCQNIAKCFALSADTISVPTFAQVKQLSNIFNIGSWLTSLADTA
jgi:hypothetical protein